MQDENLAVKGLQPRYSTMWGFSSCKGVGQYVLFTADLNPSI